MITDEAAILLCKRIIRESLYCIVCSRFLYPIKQCLLGHLLCLTCFGKVKKRCPMCRSDLSEIVISTAMHQIASKIPVICGSIDCGFTGSPSELVTHKSECRYTNYLCPACRNHVMQGSRQIGFTQGRRKVICQHYISQHSNLLIRNKRVRFAINREFFDVFERQSLTQCTQHCFYINGNLIQLWIDFNLQTDEICLAVMFYGPERERLKYQCLISVMDHNNKEYCMIVWCAPYFQHFHQISDEYHAIMKLNGIRQLFGTEKNIKASFEIIDNS